jgi:hypothetical protein
MGNSENPVAVLYRARNNNGEWLRVFGTAYGEVTFMEDLSFRTLCLGTTLDNGITRLILFLTMNILSLIELIVIPGILTIRAAMELGTNTLKL